MCGASRAAGVLALVASYSLLGHAAAAVHAETVSLEDLFRAQFDAATLALPHAALGPSGSTGRTGRSEARALSQHQAPRLAPATSGAHLPPPPLTGLHVTNARRVCGSGAPGAHVASAAYPDGCPLPVDQLPAVCVVAVGSRLQPGGGDDSGGGGDGDGDAGEGSVAPTRSPAAPITSVPVVGVVGARIEGGRVRVRLAHTFPRGLRACLPHSGDLNGGSDGDHNHSSDGGGYDDEAYPGAGWTLFLGVLSLDPRAPSNGKGGSSALPWPPTSYSVFPLNVTEAAAVSFGQYGLTVDLEHGGPWRVGAQLRFGASTPFPPHLAHLPGPNFEVDPTEQVGVRLACGSASVLYCGG